MAQLRSAISGFGKFGRDSSPSCRTRGGQKNSELLSYAHRNFVERDAVTLRPISSRRFFRQPQSSRRFALASLSGRGICCSFASSFVCRAAWTIDAIRRLSDSFRRWCLVVEWVGMCSIWWSVTKVTIFLFLDFGNLSEQ